MEIRDTIYLDDLGRAVIPKKIREYARIHKREPLDIRVLREGGEIVISVPVDRHDRT